VERRGTRALGELFFVSPALLQALHRIHSVLGHPHLVSFVFFVEVELLFVLVPPLHFRDGQILLEERHFEFVLVERCGSVGVMQSVADVEFSVREFSHFVGTLLRHLVDVVDERRRFAPCHGFELLVHVHFNRLEQVLGSGLQPACIVVPFGLFGFGPDFVFNRVVFSV